MEREDFRKLTQEVEELEAKARKLELEIKIKQLEEELKPKVVTRKKK